jgi:serine/threonine-protein kinase RsbW
MSADRKVMKPRTRLIDQSISCVLDGRAEAISAGLQEILSCDILQALTDDSRGTVEIVLAEVLNNVAEHAYAHYPGQIDVRITSGEGFLFVRLTDTGLPMPGGDLPGGALGKSVNIQDLPEGGFGWYLIRSLSQELTYLRDGAENVLSFCIGVDYVTDARALFRNLQN